MALVAYFLARPEARLIVWFHSDVIRPSWRYRLFYRPFLRFALSRASQIVVSSPPLAEHRPQRCRMAGQVHRHPVRRRGRAIRRCATVAARADEIRREIGRPIVLFVGRLVAYKGVERAARSAAGVSMRPRCSSATARCRRELEQQARSSGMADRVRFAGEVTNEELAALYRAAMCSCCRR